MSLTVAVKAVNTCVSAGKMMQNQKIQNKIMTNLDNYYQVINSTNKKMDELSRKVDEISTKADIIAQKTDALIIRDLLSANLALDDIKAVGVWDSAELLQLKNMYRVNTGLPIDGKTCGISNSQIHVMSYLGLFQIGLLENVNEKLLVRYILHMFETGESIVMTDLFPQFAEMVFGTYYRQTEEEYSHRITHWEEEPTLRDLVSHGGTILGGMVGGETGAQIGCLAGLFISAMLEKEEDSEKKREKVQSVLKKRCTEKKVEICKNVAKDMLTNSVSKAD